MGTVSVPGGVPQWSEDSTHNRSVAGSIPAAPTTPLRPKEIGERTEAIVLAELVKRGIPVLLPFGDNQRYDLVVERTPGIFLRLQCKTGRLRRGVVNFSCTSTYQTYSQSKRHRAYQGEVDAFVVYCYANDEVYLVPIEEVGSAQCSLRLAAPLNGQAKRIKRAEDYLLDVQWPSWRPSIRIDA